VANQHDPEDEEISMRKIVSWLFLSLDGVMEAPEKWVSTYYNDEVDNAIRAEADAADILLLGRRTYEVFAASWPQRTIEDDPLADWMNNTPKLVASTTLDSVKWQNSSLIRDDIVEELTNLKQQPGKDILVNGSAMLVRSLLHEDLLDELRLFLNPIVVGTGERLFENGGAQKALTLVDAQAFGTGMVHLTYQPADKQGAERRTGS
jgi:dihydrofolate reductase